jgi:hypothetical protein
MVWSRQVSRIPEQYELALRKLMFTKRQKILMTASKQLDKTLRGADLGSWVYTSAIEEVFLLLLANQ